MKYSLTIPLFKSSPGKVKLRMNVELSGMSVRMRSLMGPGGYRLSSFPSPWTVITPPDLDLVKSPVGDRGVSS